MKTILYSDPFARRTPFGTGRYARHMYHAMKALEPAMEITPVSTWTDRDADGVAELKAEYGYRKLPWNRKFTASTWAFLGQPKLEYWMGGEHELVHAMEVVYPVQTRKPLVVTIHDLGPLTHPELFTSVYPWLMKMGLRHAIDHAAAIICVSHATADAFREYFSVDPVDRLFVTHEGVNPAYLGEADPASLEGVADLPASGTPYLLTMGAISPRKNLPLVIEALERIADRVPHHLVHVGIPQWDADDFFRRLKESPIAERIHLPGYLSDVQVHALYAGATAYIYPSLFEGFGLPLLEAMATGCPILTSNRTSMPEVAGDAALLVDPENLDETTAGMLELCTNDSLREQLRQNGRDRIKLFSWEQCARKTLGIYRKVLS